MTAWMLAAAMGWITALIYFAMWFKTTRQLVAVQDRLADLVAHSLGSPVPGKYPAIVQPLCPHENPRDLCSRCTEIEKGRMG